MNVASVSTETIHEVRHILHIRKNIEMILRVSCSSRNGCEYIDSLSIRVVDTVHTPQAMLRYIGLDNRHRDIRVVPIDMFLLTKYMNWVFLFKPIEDEPIEYYVYENKLRSIIPKWNVTRSMALRQSGHKKETL